jgi:hypothetical protein
MHHGCGDRQRRQSVASSPTGRSSIAGEFAGRLLSDARALPASTDELVARAEENYEVEFTPHTKSKPAVLTIVLPG